MARPGRGANLHATALILGDRGLLIAGASGSGKTSLALALLGDALKCGRFGRLVADDQVFLEQAGGRLIAKAPEAIAGLVELRGLGPRSIAFEPACVIDLLVRLVPRGAMARVPPPDAAEALCGVPVPRLELAEHELIAAVHAVSAELRLPPFA